MSKPWVSQNYSNEKWLTISTIVWKYCIKLIEEKNIKQKWLLSTGIHGIGGQARTNQVAASGPDQTLPSLVREAGQALYILISDDYFFLFLNVFWYHKIMYIFFNLCGPFIYCRFYQPCFTTLFQKMEKWSILQENPKFQKRWYTVLLMWNWAKNLVGYFIC